MKTAVRHPPESQIGVNWFLYLPVRRGVEADSSKESSMKTSPWYPCIHCGLCVSFRVPLV